MGILREGRVPTWCDRILDGTLVLLAAWTVAYHVCLVARLGVGWAAAFAVVAVVGWLLAFGHLGRAEPAGPGTRNGWRVDLGRRSLAADLRSRWALTTVGAAAVAAIAMAVSAPWPLVWIPWLVAAGAGTWWAVQRLRPAHADPAPRVEAAQVGAAGAEKDKSVKAGAWTAAVVLAWGVGMAVVSLWTLRPSPDDLFYVNLSQWVAGHGSFPIRDTIFANLSYPMANWPPVASYDGLVGAIAWATGSLAGTIEYEVVPPIASFLAVLALWRLLRAWRTPLVAVALSIALAFLVFDANSSYATPGGLFATRLWQGKVILLCVLVPVLLVHALRYVEQPSRRRALWLFTGGVAGVALSTTAIFLVPVVALAGLLPLVRRSWRQALFGFAALAAYPLGAGVVTKALGGRSADTFDARKLYRFDGSWIGHQVFLTGGLAVLAVLAVLLGALLVTHRAARVTTGVLALAFGVVLVPGATRVADLIIGLGPTLWRLSWGCTIAALIGVGVVRLALLLPGWRALTVGAASAGALALVVTQGTPIWAGSVGVEWRTPFHWQRTNSSRGVADKLIDAVRPGGLILAPDPVAITVAVTTTSAKTVAPRAYYMYYLRQDPGFHYDARFRLVRFVNGQIELPQAELNRDLDGVGVDIACVFRYAVDRAQALRAAGMEPLLTSTYYTCLQRP